MKSEDFRVLCSITCNRKLPKEKHSGVNILALNISGDIRYVMLIVVLKKSFLGVGPEGEVKGQFIILLTKISHNVLFSHGRSIVH